MEVHCKTKEKKNMKTLKIEIDCGDKTCAKKKGQFCQFARTSFTAPSWSCLIFGTQLYSKNGWLQRCKACLDAEKTNP